MMIVSFAGPVGVRITFLCLACRDREFFSVLPLGDWGILIRIERDQVGCRKRY